MNKLKHIWQSLTTPLSKNQEAALRERMTRAIFVMVSVGVLLMSIIVPVFDFLVGDPSYTPSLIMLAIDALIVLGWYLILRGYWTVSRFLAPAIFMGLGTYFVYMVGPITSGVLQFAIAILLTAIMFGNKAQWIAVLTCVALYLSFGWLSGERDFEIFFTGGVVVGISLAGIATLQSYVSTLLATSLKRTREAELASRTMSRKLRAIFDTISDGITTTDLQENITDVNNAILRLHAYTDREELIGRNAFDFIAKPEHLIAEKNLQLTLINGNSGRQEYTLLKKDGSGFDGELTAVLIKDELKQPVGFVAITRDITSRKVAEAEREKLIQELADKNKELEQFTYTVSHDLKAPIITIKGFLGMLQRDVEENRRDDIQRDILRIDEAANNMYRLLTELLELSRIGRMMNLPQEVAFADLVNDALTVVGGHLNAGRIKITVQPDLPTVSGDRQRLMEVLQNLIDNAAKFMGGQTDPRIEIGQRGEENGKPVFYVRDNGIGIAPEHHERIFGLFNKLDPNAEGTGVGLALVKRIIEVHDGRIWVKSEIGKGSTFYFTLPRG
jgi:PAS domain S-box-containing protein